MSRETELPDGTILHLDGEKASIVIDGRFVYEFAFGPIAFDVDIAVANGWSNERILHVVNECMHLLKMTETNLQDVHVCRFRMEKDERKT